ncbi:MAG: AbrB/MazE/SpoVT family DNA-binding domain-containing protein [Lactobacillus iners]|nr:AbrB/MazE/SpoVT family DNA-binding domain-containing protein [Lactobacillus iners]
MRTVNLKQWGNSMVVRLPKSVLTQAGIGNSPTVFDISVNNDKEIILRKKKKPQNLKDLLKDLIIKSIGLNGIKNIQENPKR